MNALVQLCIKRISQVDGVGVQLYAEDRLVDMIQHKFEELAIRDWWPWLMSWVTLTLDGVTGSHTTDLSSTVRDHRDIRAIFIDGRRNPMKKLPTTVNPYLLSGTTPMYYELINSPTKLFKVWPITATGTLYAHVRTIAARYNISTTEVPFDPEALVLGTAYDYLVDDGTNPDASNKMRDMFDARVNELLKQNVGKNLTLNPDGIDVVNTWTDTYGP